MSRIAVCIATCLSLLLAAGCSGTLLPSFYKIDIRQGNYIDETMVQQLQPGMTKSQVTFLLGTPLLSDPFHPERWDYIYYLLPGGKKGEERKVSLFFEGDLLSRIDTDLDVPI
jgi:outer membrane protein assembly factor BamE